MERAMRKRSEERKTKKFDRSTEFAWQLDEAKPKLESSSQEVERPGQRAAGAREWSVERDLPASPRFVAKDYSGTDSEARDRRRTGILGAIRPRTTSGAVGGKVIHSVAGPRNPSEEIKKVLERERRTGSKVERGAQKRGETAVGSVHKSKHPTQVEEDAALFSPARVSQIGASGTRDASRSIMARRRGRKRHWPNSANLPLACHHLNELWPCLEIDPLDELILDRRGPTTAFLPGAERTPCLDSFYSRPSCDRASEDAWLLSTSEFGLDPTRDPVREKILSGRFSCARSNARRKAHLPNIVGREIEFRRRGKAVVEGRGEDFLVVGDLAWEKARDWESLASDQRRFARCLRRRREINATIRGTIRTPGAYFRLARNPRRIGPSTRLARFGASGSLSSGGRKGSSRRRVKLNAMEIQSGRSIEVAIQKRKRGEGRVALERRY
ncbi:hypothetical protein KM043_001634 [Ampulex compressa]|nr:hypothetical protein KM043_001634 [Ampulex compressa]